MGVLFPNAELRVGVRAHPFARDSHGQPITTTTPEWGDAFPGSVLEQAGSDADVGVEYSLRLDPKQWPLEEGDKVYDGTVEYVVTKASIHVIAGMPNAPVNHVKAAAVRKIPKVP